METKIIGLMEIGRVPKKINRSINWGAQETMTLLRLLRERPGLICSSKANGGGMDPVVRLRLWREVARQMQILHPLISRSYMECQFRWKNLLRRAKKEIADHTIHKEMAAKGLGSTPKPVARLTQQVLAVAREAKGNAWDFFQGVFPMSTAAIALPPGSAPSQITSNSPSTNGTGTRSQDGTAGMAQRFPPPNLSRNGAWGSVPRLSKPTFSLERRDWEEVGTVNNPAPVSMPHLTIANSLRATQTGLAASAHISHGRMGSLHYVNAGDPSSTSSSAVTNPTSVENPLWTPQPNISSSGVAVCRGGGDGLASRWHPSKGRSECTGAVDDMSAVPSMQCGGEDIIMIEDENTTELPTLKEQFPHTDQSSRIAASAQQQPLPVTGTHATTVCETGPHTSGMAGLNSRGTFPHSGSPLGRNYAGPGKTSTTTVLSREAPLLNQTISLQGRGSSSAGALPSAPSGQRVTEVTGRAAQAAPGKSRYVFSDSTNSFVPKTSPVPSRPSSSFGRTKPATPEDFGCDFESSSNGEAAATSGSPRSQRSLPEFGVEDQVLGGWVKHFLSEHASRPETDMLPHIKDEPQDEEGPVESDIVVIKDEPPDETDTPTEREELSPNLPLSNGFALDVAMLQPVSDPAFSVQTVQQAAEMSHLTSPALSGGSQREEGDREGEGGERGEERRNLELANLRLQNECWQILRSNLLLQQQILRRNVRENM